MQIQKFVSLLGVWTGGKGPLHGKLARAIQTAVALGSLPPGIRLPAERSLADALKLSRTTVVTAYNGLRSENWVESRQGSGTYVCARSPVVHAARHAEQASRLASSPLLGMYRYDPATFIDLALGTTFSLTAMPSELYQLPEEEHQALLHERLYHPMGLPALRDAIALHYTKAGLATKPEQVLVTNGAQQGISLASLLYVQRGDTVLIEDPTYFGALDVFRNAGARMEPLPVGKDGVAASHFRERLRATGARLTYLTPSFQNPTGSVMPQAARRAVARASEELGAPIIEDESLVSIGFDGASPAPLAAYSETAPILTLGSLSKLMWQGLRIGWVRASEGTIERLCRLKISLEIGSPLWTQSVAVRLVEAIPLAQKLRRAQLMPRRDLLAGLLRKRLSDWEFQLPTGGLFLWVKLPSGDARELAQVALRHGVVILPGSAASPVEGYINFVRIPFLAEPETLRAAVDRLAAAWRDYRESGRPVRVEMGVV
jgi:DNA-binding transcriptional MocR family regulator